MDQLLRFIVFWTTFVAVVSLARLADAHDVPASGVYDKPTQECFVWFRSTMDEEPERWLVSYIATPRTAFERSDELWIETVRWKYNSEGAFVFFTEFTNPALVGRLRCSPLPYLSHTPVAPSLLPSPYLP